MTDRPVKQVIVIRRDLKMRRGKEIAQGAHASMAWLTERLLLPGSYDHSTDPHPGAWAECRLSEPEYEWLSGSFTKVTCQAGSQEELDELALRAHDAGILAHVVTDAGFTEFHGVPTETALAIGPDWSDVVDQVTAGLALY